jgi:hypothetical protein
MSDSIHIGSHRFILERFFPLKTKLKTNTRIFMLGYYIYKIGLLLRTKDRLTKYATRSLRSARVCYAAMKLFCILFYTFYTQPTLLQILQRVLTLNYINKVWSFGVMIEDYSLILFFC